MREVTIRGDGNAFALQIHLGMQDHYLHTQRGDVRRWKEIATLLRYLRELGIGHARIDFTAWTPGQGDL